MARFGNSSSQPGNSGDAVVKRPDRPEGIYRTSVPITPEAIARRACEIWVKKGRPQGQDQQNWDEAEALLRDEQRWN